MLVRGGKCRSMYARRMVCNTRCRNESLRRQSMPAALAPAGEVGIVESRDEVQRSKKMFNERIQTCMYSEGKEEGNCHLTAFIYLFLSALGLCCCTWAFSRCGEWRLLFTAVASLVECDLQAHGFHQPWCSGLVAPRHVGSSLTRD